MTAQRKITTRRPSAKDREFERLLRRAALYLKSRKTTEIRVIRKKRVAAA